MLMNQFKQFINKFKQDESGALNEFLGFIFFLMLVFGVMLPLLIELFAYTGQAQEVDKLARSAAKKACSLSADSTMGVASDLKQGNLGVGMNISMMHPLVNDTIRQEAAHPNTYFENTPDGQNIDFKVFDMTGQRINLLDVTTVIRPDGSRGEAVLVGSNTESSLCPSGGGGDWKYCLNPNSDEAIRRQVRETGIRAKDKDLIQRMQRFQAGRCREGETNCEQDFVGRIDRCTVCLRKTRRSIFRGTLWGGVLACETANDTGRIIPCKMVSCATEKIARSSTKRGYNPAYQNERNLGSEQFNTVEVDYREAQNDRNTLLKEETKLTKEQDRDASREWGGEGTKEIFAKMGEQFVSVKDNHAAK
jgi:hypothetical protein